MQLPPGMEKKRPMDSRVFSGSHLLPSNRMIPVFPLPATPPPLLGISSFACTTNLGFVVLFAGKLVRGESAEAKEASSIDRSIYPERNTERNKGERWGTMWRCRSMERSLSEGRGQGLLLGRWQEGRGRWGGTERRFSLSCLSTLELLHQEM
jgi:hypothetical protein